MEKFGDTGETEEIILFFLMFAVQLLPEPAAHCCDEGSSFPTAVL